MYDIPCVILSGGKSSRMGEDKSLLPFNEYDTLIEYQYKKLSKLFKKVYISSKTDKFNFLNNSSNIILDNTKDISSPMVALDSIFEKLIFDKVFIITVDVPYVEFSTIKMIIENGNNCSITIAKDKNRVHNLCGLFSRNILFDIKKLLKKDIHKINYLIKNCSSYHELEFLNENQFINLNTIEDYNNAINISKDYRLY